MDTINRLPKGVPTIFGEDKLTVTDKVKTSTLLNAKVTLTTKDNIEGQIEIKIHKPSDKRQRATIEIRKLTGFDFDTVEKVKDLLTNMLDQFSLGETVSKVSKAKGKAKPYSSLVKQPSLATKLLSCTKCDYSIKSMPALKNHTTKNHNQPSSKCNVCGFESNEDDMTNHMKEFHIVHQSIKIQNKRNKSVFNCEDCSVTTDSKKKLKNHKDSQHYKLEESSSSPDPSPPQKKQTRLSDTEVQNSDTKKIEDFQKAEGLKLIWTWTWTKLARLKII